jgi:hypothetical protein
MRNILQDDGKARAPQVSRQPTGASEQVQFSFSKGGATCLCYEIGGLLYIPYFKTSRKI